MSISATVPSISLESTHTELCDEPLAATVCICAHNEAHVLADAVESVMAQRLSADQYEVLVVDSASTDRTPELLCTLKARWGARLRWVREEESGLSRARNRGLAEADGTIVAFIDADAVADPGWLTAIVDAFHTQANVGAVGGPVNVKWDHDTPKWWRRELDEVFNHYSPCETAARLRYPRYPYGTNLAVRTEAAAALGGFSNGLGRRGRTLLAGEDGEMCLRLEKARWLIWFEPGATVHHRTKAERISKTYILRRAFRHGRSQRAIERMHSFDSGLYPSMWTLIGLLLSRVFTLRCTVLFMKFWLFRAGYRWEGLVGGSLVSDAHVGGATPSPQPSPSGRGRESIDPSKASVLQ